MSLKRMEWRPRAGNIGTYIVEITGPFPERAKTIPDGKPAKTGRIIKVLSMHENEEVRESYSVGSFKCCYEYDLYEIDQQGSIGFGA